MKQALDTIMRIAIYIRVSTMDQVEGYSLDNQRERLTAFCKAQGWEDVTVYMDDGESGTNMDRPGLKRLIRHVEEKKINGVVVLKLDRLSRKQKDVLYLLEEVFEKHGVIFKSATEPFDTSTPLGKAMIGVLAVFAQLERDMIVERTVGGKLQRIRSGKWPGGHSPFGYRWPGEGDDLEVVPDEAETVKEIFKRFIDGESYNQLGIWAQEKHPSFTFDSTIIKRVISRPTYAGKMRYSGNTYDSSTEAIIDEDTWQDSQRELMRRDGGLPPRGEYLLTGLCRCNLCGSSVVHETKQYRNKSSGKIYYKDYICCKAQKFKPYSCNMGYHQRVKIENYIIDEIKATVSYPEKILTQLDNGSDDDNTELIRALEQRIKSAESGLENLLEAIQLGIVKAASVAKRIRDLEEDKAAAESSLDELRDKKSPSRATIDVSFVQEVGELWNELTEEEQKIALRKLIISVKVNARGENPEIIWNLST